MNKPSTNQKVFLISNLMVLLALTTACADQANDSGQQSDLKQYGYDEYGYYESDGHYSNDDESHYDDIWVQTEADSPADSSESSNTETHQEEATPAHHTGSVSLGGTCAPGCIWSAYAVEVGAQAAEVTCGSSSCACVVEGDVWSSCSESDDSSSNNNTSQPDNPEPPASADPNYNASLGNQLADAAYGIAVSRNTTGYCYSAAADAIESVVGRFLWGASAYMAADQLASHSRFFEVSVSDLRTLPAGAVVVWGRGNSEHGHISIALGDGREASDHVTSQMTYHYGGGRARVFYPR